jgi:hypothetical protein
MCYTIYTSDNVYGNVQLISKMKYNSFLYTCMIYLCLVPVLGSVCFI